MHKEIKMANNVSPRFESVKSPCIKHIISLLMAPLLHPCAIIYLSCQSPPLEFTRARNVAGMMYAHVHKRRAQMKQIWFHQKTTWWWEASGEAANMRRGKKKRIVSFIWYHNRFQRGRMCWSRCGMAEKIREEHGVAKINSKAAVWKASLSFSLLNPYWHLKSNFRAQKNQDLV